MLDYKVSWLNNENQEWFSEWMNKEDAIKLFYEISTNKVDEEQTKCNLYYFNNIIKFSYNK